MTDREDGSTAEMEEIIGDIDEVLNQVPVWKVERALEDAKKMLIKQREMLTVLVNRCYAMGSGEDGMCRYCIFREECTRIRGHK